jgi:hypothetical protein
MNALRFSPQALGLCAVVVMLAGCGGANTAMSGTVPQDVMAQGRAHEASGSSGDLIYVTTTKQIVMLSYPDGNVVGTLPWYGASLDSSICSDPNNGNVVIPEGSSGSDSKIYEYAHGATTPTAILSLPAGDSEPNGCAVDPTTGNLAVIAWIPPTNQNAFVIYPGGQGTPTTYKDNKVLSLFYAAYDDSGDLFSITQAHFGVRLAELRPGQSKFNILKFASCQDCNWSKLQWDGQYLTLTYGDGIGQLALSRKTATLVNVVPLTGLANRNLGFYWIQNGSVFAEYQKLRKNYNEGVGVWPYPSGGNPMAKFYGVSKGPKDTINDLTVSINPSRPRNRR